MRRITNVIELEDALQKSRELFRDLQFFIPVVLKTTDLTQQRLAFKDCEFHAPLDLSRLRNEVSIKFQSCSFEVGQEWDKVTLSTLDLEDCKFEVSPIINEITLSTSLCLTNISGKEIEIGDLKCKRLRIIGQLARLAFYHLIVEEAIISVSKGGSQISINAASLNTEEQPSYVGRMQLDYFQDPDQNVFLVDLSIGKFTLIGTNNDSILSMNGCNFKDIVLKQFSNNGVLKAHNCIQQRTDSLRIIESNVGGAELFDVDFSKVLNVLIRNAHIEEVVASNVTWCKEIQATDKNHAAKREIYRQLKNIAKKAHNKPEEIKFRGYEMDAYRQELSDGEGSAEEKFILWTNRLSNNHGRSALQPFLLLVVGNSIVYSCIKAVLGHNTFDFTLLAAELGNFLEFINPVHKYQDIFKEENGFSRILDVVGRVLSGYLLFQFFRAFRRFAE